MGMKKMNKNLTHAQFKEYLDGLEKELKLCLDGKSTINLPQESCIALIAAFFAAKEEFNKVRDIATELENIIDSALDIQPSDPLLSRYSEGFKGALNFIKDKIRELKGEN